MNNNEREDLIKAAMKKAVGQRVTESAEEYTFNDGEKVLSKQKVVTKDSPPDVSAIKLLLEQGAGEFENMSDEDLMREKKRLIRLLIEERH